MSMSVTALKRSIRHWRAAEESARKRLQVAKAKRLLRERQLKTATSGPAGTVRFALLRVGTTENPPGSNRGKLIDAWQRRFGMQGQPWCGAFVGAALEAGGKIDVSSRIVYTPYIVQDAQLRRNGFDGWFTAGQAKPGDLVLFDFDGGQVDHVGIVHKAYDHSGFLYTIEGNTSSGNAGSQDNGGGVFLRKRPLSQVRGIARPKWKA